MIKNIIFDLGNVILKDFPYIVLENLNLSNETYKIIKNKFFNNWDNLDLGNESLQEHLDNCGIDSIIDDKVDNIKVAEQLGMNGYVLDIKNQGIYELKEKLKENNINL